MDEQLTLHELRRLEAQRKLSTIPSVILETAWVREVQIEAVIDAVLAITVGGDAKAYARARHVGQWCARIAEALPFGPDPSFARRVGVLADVDPDALERIDELKRFASYVREYQSAAMDRADARRTMSIIVAVADEFDARISAGMSHYAPSPSAALASMDRHSDAARKRIVGALARAVHPRNVRVA